MDPTGKWKISGVRLIQPCWLLTDLGGTSTCLWVPGYERKENRGKCLGEYVGGFVVWSKVRTKSGKESHVQWPPS